MSVRNNTIDLLWVFRRSEEEDCVEGTKILCVSDGEEVVTFVVLSKKIRSGIFCVLFADEREIRFCTVTADLSQKVLSNNLLIIPTEGGERKKED